MKALVEINVPPGKGCCQYAQTLYVIAFIQEDSIGVSDDSIDSISITKFYHTAIQAKTNHKWDIHAEYLSQDKLQQIAVLLSKKIKRPHFVKGLLY